MLGAHRDAIDARRPAVAELDVFARKMVPVCGEPMRKTMGRALIDG